MKRIHRLWLSLFIIFYMPYVFAKPTWPVWVAELKREAIAEGINPNLFDQIFATIPGPDSKVMRLDHTQPERRITFLQYRDSRGDKYKILIGRQEYRKYSALLQEIGNAYGVDPCAIVALWGMETSYGHYMGNFPVIKSLATLAYDARRSDKFRSELLLALKIVNQNQIRFEDYKGEWAGASGQPQFLPSSWFKYAVDYDHDGRKNIWTSESDVFASIANYLAKNGWQSIAPISTQVILPANFEAHLMGKNIKKPISAWDAMGVRTISGASLPLSTGLVSIIELNGGSAFMIYPNFNVLLSYNNSNYYAATISYMADQICRR